VKFRRAWKQVSTVYKNSERKMIDIALISSFLLSLLALSCKVDESESGGERIEPKIKPDRVVHGAHHDS
jgi:hypothetical protein